MNRLTYGLSVLLISGAVLLSSCSMNLGPETLPSTTPSTEPSETEPEVTTKQTTPESTEPGSEALVTEKVVERYGNLTTKGTMLWSSKGEQVVLKGMSSYGIQDCMNFFTPDVVKTLAEDWGCDVLRITINGDADTGYMKEPDKYFDPICKIIDMCVEQGIYIIIDWNPDSEFWYEQQGLSGREGTTEIVTTYLDNPYLGETQIAAIEAYRTDERWWKVYGLGETGNRKGLIYTDWEQCKDIPTNARLVGRGLDFGYQADPTSIVAVYIMDGELYIDEELYAPGLTNDRIAQALRGKGGVIVADSAEPKSIAEIRNYGIRNIEPSVKCADSVRNGIQVVQRYKMHITQRSLNIIRELRNYRWAEDKVTGELKNEPAKSEHFDHALDALRYLVTAKLQQRGTGTAKYNPTYLYQYGQ